MRVRSLDWEDPLEEGMATHSSVFLPGESHGRRSLVGYRVESDMLKTQHSTVILESIFRANLIRALQTDVSSFFPSL